MKRGGREALVAGDSARGLRGGAIAVFEGGAGVVVVVGGGAEVIVALDFAVWVDSLVLGRLGRGELGREGGAWFNVVVEEGGGVVDML